MNGYSPRVDYTQIILPGKKVHLFVTSFVEKWDHFVFFRFSPLHLIGFPWCI